MRATPAVPKCAAPVVQLAMWCCETRCGPVDAWCSSAVGADVIVVCGPELLELGGIGDRLAAKIGVMPRKVRQRQCVDCGATFFRAIRAGRPVICYPCAAQRMAEAALALHEHRGPLWDNAVLAHRQWSEEMKAEEGQFYDAWLAGIAADLDERLCRVESRRSGA